MKEENDEERNRRKEDCEEVIIAKEGVNEE